MSKLVTRCMRVRRNKYTKRKGYRKYKKHYTRKNAKRIQNKKRLRRQTRRKRGGEKVSGVVPGQLDVDLELPQDVDRDPVTEALVDDEDTSVATPALADEVTPPNTESTGYEILEVLSNLYRKRRETLTLNNSNIDKANLDFVSSLSSKFRYYSPTNNLGKLVKVFIDKIIGVKDSTIERAQPIIILRSLLSLLGKIKTNNEMQNLLQLLNSMTPENMQKLLQLLNSMTPENMQKLLQLLNSMTPKTMKDLLFSLIHDTEEDNITTILDDYIKLDAESMAQLLELYSFIEKREFNDNTNMYSVHRYANGKTPLSQRLLRNIKHKPTTCKSVQSLDATADKFNLNKSIIKFDKDDEFTKVLKECELYPPLPEVVTGGGRKRKTLKKKRRHGNKR